MTSGALLLDKRDRAMLDGSGTPAEQLAMRVVATMAHVMGAESLLDITGAHIDSCLYHGQAGLDFAERLVAGGGRVRVPTTLNVATLDRLHPELFRGDPETARVGRRLMDCYVEMGGRPTFTCAPYQLAARPAFGEQIAWAESNAIVFANSVLGARTHRYGDFIDICAAITGRVPAAGLHLTENRRGRLLFRLDRVPERLLGEDVLFPVLGYLVGRRSGQRVPVIAGLAAGTTEDQLKALGAAAAAAGSVAMFHAVGLTPEAPSLEAACGNRPPEETINVDGAMLRSARDALSTGAGGPLRAVSLGTPHYSVAELGRLLDLLDGRHVAVDCYVSTGRDVLAEITELGWADRLRAAGVEMVADTCTYITPILRRVDGVAMTDSGKWAYYAPGNLGVDVAFGSTTECVESAVAGEVRRDPGLWADA